MPYSDYVHITTFAHGNTYLSSTIQNPASTSIDSLSYLSFEDALWEFLAQKVPLGSTLLFPDFFCTDVWDNCRAHGYTVETYPVTEDLTIKQEHFWSAVKRYNPAVVFVFHTFGIQNSLLSSDLFARYSGWVIEDSVHRIIEPTRLTLLDERHIVIDSTRKLTPLLGSQIFARKNVLTYTSHLSNSDPESHHHTTQKILAFWKQFQDLLASADFAQVTQAYELLNSGDNLIGDSMESLGLDHHFLEQRKYLDMDTIHQAKQQHYSLYETRLESILKDERFVISWKRETAHKGDRFDGSDLAFYPLILHSDYAFLLKEYLLKRQIQTFVEFSDSPWAINKNIICLPLGPHVTSDQIELACHCILEWFGDRSTLA